MRSSTGRPGCWSTTRDELAGALLRVLGDPGLRRRLSAGALRHARSFSWDSTAHHTLLALTREAQRQETPANGSRTPA